MKTMSKRDTLVARKQIDAKYELLQVTECVIYILEYYFSHNSERCKLLDFVIELAEHFMYVPSLLACECGLYSHLALVPDFNFEDACVPIPRPRDFAFR